MASGFTRKLSLAVIIGAAGLAAPVSGQVQQQTSFLGWVPPEMPATQGIESINISNNRPDQGSVFPQVAVSRKDPNLIAVAWRRYALPVDTNTLDLQKTGECHVAISRDGGKTFSDTNMMQYFRTQGSPPDPAKARTVVVQDQGVNREYLDPGAEPAISACNAPWVTIASDGTIYAGGALYTAGGTVQKYPRQGRAGMSVSRDGGRTWSPMRYGIRIAKFAPGVTGLQGGMEPWHTPWDGANGVVDPVTGTFYSTAGATVVTTDDKTETFGTVYSTGGGTISAAYGIAAVARTVMEDNVFPGKKCPCLAFSVSTDKAKNWKPIFVADADQYNRTGTVRYPVIAADPAHKGSFAIAVYTPDHKSVKVYYTTDTGETWKSAEPRPIPANWNVPVFDSNMVGVGYTTDGRILLTWRGFRGPGAFNTFAAMITNGSFGPTVKVSNELSVYPPLTYMGNYGIGNGVGDFTTWVQGNDTTAFVAYPYAPGGQIENTFLARIPLTLLSDQR